MSNVLKNVVYLPCQTIKKRILMQISNKSQIDAAAKELWQKIGELQSLLLNSVRDEDSLQFHDEDSFQFYYDFLKKSSEFARYIDKNFYND